MNQEEVDKAFEAIVADLYPNEHELREQAHYGLSERNK